MANTPNPSEVVTLNPLGIKVVQQPDLCPASMLSEICTQQGINFGRNLEDLAVKTGVHIKKKHKHLYGPELRKLALNNDDARIGLLYENFENPEFLKTIYNELGGLTAKAVRPSEIGGITDRSYNPKRILSKVDDFLLSNLLAGHPIGINFRLEPFTGREDGHWIFAHGYHKDSHQVYFVDSSPLIGPYARENITKFLDAMQAKFKEDDGKVRERGFIVFSGPNNGEKMSKKEIEKIIESTPKYKPVNARIRIHKSHPFTRNRPYIPRNNPD